MLQYGEFRSAMSTRHYFCSWLDCVWIDIPSTETHWSGKFGEFKYLDCMLYWGVSADRTKLEMLIQLQQKNFLMCITPVYSNAEVIAYCLKYCSCQRNFYTKFYEMLLNWHYKNKITWILYVIIFHCKYVWLCIGKSKGQICQGLCYEKIEIKIDVLFPPRMSE